MVYIQENYKNIMDQHKDVLSIYMRYYLYYIGSIYIICGLKQMSNKVNKMNRVLGHRCAHIC